MISTSEVVPRVTHWWQQTVKDVVIVRADFFEKFIIYVSAQLRKRKKVGGSGVLRISNRWPNFRWPLVLTQRGAN